MEYDLRDYIKVLQKRVWMIVIIVLVSTMTTGVVSYFFIKPVYEASTKLIVNKSNEQVGQQQFNMDVVNTNLALINTYKEVIKTPAIMEIVAEQNPDFNLTTEQLINKVTVSSVNNTQVMTLQVQDNSYPKAVKIVNAVSKVFEQEIPKIMKVDNVSLLNEAELSDTSKPVKPNKLLNVVISFVVSLMVALGIAFLLEYLDDTIKTESDVEQFLGLPTLAMISKMQAEDISGQQTAKRQVGEAKHVTVNQ